MEIYIVQIGDDIFSIADNYGVPVMKLIQDNGLVNPYNLVLGQAIIIVFPSQTHTVEEGDTLASIANTYDVTLMQLLRNNSFLSERNYIYPGETLVIKYNTNQKISINGFTYAFINKDILIKTLPYLTYLSVFNYRISEGAEIITYQDDSELIKLAKDYGVVPLMMLSVLSLQGDVDIELAYSILLNEENHSRLITNILNILKSSGYNGINLLISIISESNQKIYLDLLTKISIALNNEGYLFFITINPNLTIIDDEISFEQLDYSSISKLVSGIMFLQYVWGRKPGPPSPVSSFTMISDFIDYTVTTAPPEAISIGNPLIAYNWALPYNELNKDAYSLTLNAAIILAYDVGAAIQFDETSQTPYYQYQTIFASTVVDQIVWYIDVRSINAVFKLIIEKALAGSGIWNIMIYYQQIWTLIISQYEIEKILPEE
jgi:spore germination protein